MLTFNLNEFKNGWVVGDFTPSLIKSRDAEVAIKRYSKDTREPKHMHRLADEITIVIDGRVAMNGKIYDKDTVILTKAGESVEFIAVTDAVTCVIKSPSVQGDKYLV